MGGGNNMSDRVLAAASRATSQTGDSTCVRARNGGRAARLCLALAALLVTPVFADPVDIKLPPQPLSSALRELARQAGLQLAIQSELTRGKMAAALNGRYEPSDALAALLKGTGLTAYLVNTNTYGIREDRGAAAKKDSFHGTNWQAGASAAQLEPSDPQEAGPRDSRTAELGSKLSLEEVVVTAQKRAEKLQDVPLSVVVVSSEELSRRNVTNMDDLLFVVPGLVVSKQGAGHSVYIRGVSNTTGTSPLVGMYLDEANITANSGAAPDVDTYDLQRVEVLRGPQGTLYGEGSLGGTIRFISNDPVLNAFQAKADIAGLYTQDGAPSQRIQEVVNIPLIDNQLGLRIAGQFDHEGGWIDQPAAHLTDINDQNIADVRGKVLWKPTDPLTVSALVELHRNSGGVNTGEDTPGIYVAPFDVTAPRRVKYYFNLYNLTTSYEFGAAKLLNTATYVEQNTPLANYGYQAQFVAPPAPLSNVYIPAEGAGTRSVNDELRFMSTGTGPWRWTVGAFYRNFNRHSWFSPYYYGVAGPLPIETYTSPDARMGSKSWSAFGETSYELFDRLTLGAGARYFSDDETTSPPDQKGRFHSVDPRLYADLKVAQSLNIYLSAAKGFRSGGLNYLGQPPYNPESLWTYELGAKMSLLQRRLSVDADVFYSKYSNYQVFAITPPTFLGMTTNSGNAKIKGAEATLVWRPVPAWTVSANGSYLDAYIASAPASATDVVGDTLDYVPKYQGTASVQRDFTWSGREAYLRADYSLQGRATYRNRQSGPWYVSESDVIHMLDLNTGLIWNENLTVTLFAQNLLNDRGYQSADVIEQSASRVRPRTYGVQLSVKFE
jgi:iron complex outermembrane receptor protein